MNRKALPEHVRVNVHVDIPSVLPHDVPYLSSVDAEYRLPVGPMPEVADVQEGPLLERHRVHSPCLLHAQVEQPPTEVEVSCPYVCDIAYPAACFLHEAQEEGVPHGSGHLHVILVRAGPVLRPCDFEHLQILIPCDMRRELIGALQPQGAMTRHHGEHASHTCAVVFDNCRTPGRKRRSRTHAGYLKITHFCMKG